MFVLNPNRKGAIAEVKIAAVATELGIPVLRPIQEHGRYDLAFEIGNRLYRIQCKWASLDRKAGVIKVQLRTSWYSPNGYVLNSYTPDEIDLVAVYCGDLDQCYLLSSAFVAGRRAVWLRVSPVRNGQRAFVNLALDYEFAGAVAQLEERRAGSAKAGGSSPPSSTNGKGSPQVHTLGAHEFRNHFGYYMERAAAGEEIHVTRRGKSYVRLMAPATLLEKAA
jgi:prevent-host-death family protein